MDGATPRDPSLGHPPGAHLFVDESKERVYVLVAAVIAPADLTTTRTFTRSLIYRGQARLHMKKESEPRKRLIADAIADSGVRAVVYTADRGNDELTARAACLNALIEDAAQMGAHRLVLERDDSLIRWDNQRLIELTRRYGCRDSLSYEFMRANEELLLCLPDAIAWCWTKGGHWRSRITVAVHAHREV